MTKVNSSLALLIVPKDMVIILIIYLLFIFALFGLLYLLLRWNTKHGLDKINSLYYDEDGNHIYYERSLIEKLRFLRHNPGCHSIRSIRHLLYGFFTSVK